MTREWQPKKTYVVVEVSPGDLRDHTSCLSLSLGFGGHNSLWDLRSHLFSGFGCHSPHSKESSISGFPKPYLTILTSWWLCTYAAGLHANPHLILHVSQEDRGSLRGPCPSRQILWDWRVDSVTSREVQAFCSCFSQCWTRPGLFWAHCLPS